MTRWLRRALAQPFCLWATGWWQHGGRLALRPVPAPPVMECPVEQLWCPATATLSSEQLMSGASVGAMAGLLCVAVLPVGPPLGWPVASWRPPCCASCPCQDTGQVRTLLGERCDQGCGSGVAGGTREGGPPGAGEQVRRQELCPVLRTQLA